MPLNHTQIGAWVNSKMSGRNPPLYCTITLIVMQGRQPATQTNKQCHRPISKRFITTSLLHIENSLDRLGLLSPTHDQRSQQQSGQITLQLVLISVHEIDSDAFRPSVSTSKPRHNRVNFVKSRPQHDSNTRQKNNRLNKVTVFKEKSECT